MVRTLCETRHHRCTNIWNQQLSNIRAHQHAQAVSSRKRASNSVNSTHILITNMTQRLTHARRKRTAAKVRSALGSRMCLAIRSSADERCKSRFCRRFATTPFCRCMPAFYVQRGKSNTIQPSNRKHRPTGALSRPSKRQRYAHTHKCTLTQHCSCVPSACTVSLELSNSLTY
jgi:hypothetical protein